MTTRNIVPRGNGEGQLGTAAKHWAKLFADVINEGANLGNNASLGYRQPSTAYTVGQIAYHSALPTGYYLECTTPGITAAGDITPSSTIGDTVTDGTVIWTVSRDLPLIGGGALTGNNLTWNGADLGGASIVAQSLGANGYVKYSNGLIMQWKYAGLIAASTGHSNPTYVDYPISFTQKPIVFTQRYQSAYDLNSQLYVNDALSTKDKAAIYNLGTQNGYAFVFAIGY